ncbi:MAG TPA: hypothetical protein VGK00_08825 [Anaerolineales bacterium]|jgi:hypothetical protein
MENKNFGDNFYVSDHNERIDKFTNIPVANPDPETGEAPVQDTPLDLNTTGTGPQYGTDFHEPKVEEALPDPATMPYDALPVGDENVHADVPVAPKSPTSATLLEPAESEHLRTRWNEIQGKFVDEPRAAVQQADVLVSEVVEKITQMFASEHHTLEEQWKQGNDVSTEDLRKALQHYRSFFNRLVV